MGDSNFTAVLIEGPAGCLTCVREGVGQIVSSNAVVSSGSSGQEGMSRGSSSVGEQPASSVSACGGKMRTVDMRTRREERRIQRAERIERTKR